MNLLDTSRTIVSRGYTHHSQAFQTYPANPHDLSEASKYTYGFTKTDKGLAHELINRGLYSCYPDALKKIMYPLDNDSRSKVLLQKRRFFQYNADLSKIYHPEIFTDHGKQPKKPLSLMKPLSFLNLEHPMNEDYYASPLAASPKGTVWAYAADLIIHIFSLQKCILMVRLNGKDFNPEFEQKTICCLTFPPSGTHLEIGMEEGGFQQYDFSQCKTLRSFPFIDETEFKIPKRIFSLCKREYFTTFIGTNNTLSMIDLRMQKVVKIGESHLHRQPSISCYGDRLLAMAGDDNSFSLFDTNMNKQIASSPTQEATVKTCFLNSNTLVTAGGINDKLLKIWDINPYPFIEKSRLHLHAQATSINYDLENTMLSISRGYSNVSTPWYPVFDVLFLNMANHLSDLQSAPFSVTKGIHQSRPFCSTLGNKMLYVGSINKISQYGLNPIKSKHDDLLYSSFKGSNKIEVIHKKSNTKTNHKQSCLKLSALGKT